MELYSVDTCMSRSRNTTMQYKERGGGGFNIDLVDKDKLINISSPLILSSATSAAESSTRADRSIRQ